MSRGMTQPPNESTVHLVEEMPVSVSKPEK